MNKVGTFIVAALVIFAGSSQSAYGQQTSITISLTEQFFDAVVEAIYTHGQPPEFSLASADPDVGLGPIASILKVGTGASFVRASYSEPPGVCRDIIRVLRESGGVRTAVRFRNGAVLAPLAFSGSYNPPFIGCVEFAGWAETSLDLAFDQERQRLIANAKVMNVSLNGTGGVGGNLIAKMVQSAIDRKINPIELIQVDKLSFVVPMQSSGNITMKATHIHHEVRSSQLDVRVHYTFIKGT